MGSPRVPERHWSRDRRCAIIRCRTGQDRKRAKVCERVRDGNRSLPLPPERGDLSPRQGRPGGVRLLKAMTAYFQKFANWIGWSSFGALIGIIALFLTIDFKKTDVHMFILSDTNLVDVKSPLNDLQILYNGKDLIKEHLNLHLYRVQVQNTGGTILLKDDFDNNDLWGIHVSTGNIVKIGEPESELSYIGKNLAIRTPDQMTLLFTPIIFEPGLLHFRFFRSLKYVFGGGFANKCG